MEVQIKEEDFGLVKRIISSLFYGIKETDASYDDIFSDGCLGLTKAYNNYNANFATQHFKSYKYRRIQGEILDGIRSRGWVGRYTYKKMVKAESFIPNQIRSCDHLVMDENYQPIEIAYITSQNTEVDPYKQIEAEDAVCYVFDGLTEVEKIIFSCYYFLNMTQKDIGNIIPRQLCVKKTFMGKDIGISESRVAQIRLKALERLRDEFELFISPCWE